jgi:hypothetical protein
MNEKTQIKKRFWDNWKNWNLKAAAKKILLIILGLWIVFSVGYVLRDQWIKFQNRQILAAYQNGVANTLRTLMSQAELCQPVSLMDGDKKIELIKVGCSGE